jgi:hypothetical protein
MRMASSALGADIQNAELRLARLVGWGPRQCVVAPAGAHRPAPAGCTARFRLFFRALVVGVFRRFSLHSLEGVDGLPSSAGLDKIMQHAMRRLAQEDQIMSESPLIIAFILFLSILVCIFYVYLIKVGALGKYAHLSWF